jgi:hypothetical protein
MKNGLFPCRLQVDLFIHEDSLSTEGKFSTRIAPRTSTFLQTLLCSASHIWNIKNKLPQKSLIILLFGSKHLMPFVKKRWQRIVLNSM